VCYVARRTRRAWKDWQTGLIIATHNCYKREFPNHRSFTLFSHPRKVRAKCFETRCSEIIEYKLDGVQFFWGLVALQTNFSLGNKCSRNLGTIPKMSALILSTSKNIRSRSSRKKLTSLREYGVDGRLLPVKSLYCCIDVWTFSFIHFRATFLRGGSRG